MTGTIEVCPVNWAALRDIDDVEPFGDHDTQCLAEIRGVLLKHNKMERLGIALLHSHFEMADDEILLETVNPVSRTLVSKAVKEAEVAHKKVATILMLRDGEGSTMGWCRQYCAEQIFGHAPRHNREK